MEQRKAISTENLTIIPDVKPLASPLTKNRPSAPLFRDETVSEPDRTERFSINSFMRPTVDVTRKGPVGEQTFIQTDKYGRPVRQAITPQIFDDRNDSPTIEEYLFRFERTAKANQWRDSDKVDQIYHYLRGNAEKCYEDVLRLNKEIKWPELKSILEERFTKKYGRVVALEKMYQREQGNRESFRNYFYDKMALIRQVDNGFKTEDKLMYLIQGTRPEIRREIRRYLYDKKIENDDELYSIVYDLDDLDITGSESSHNNESNNNRDRKADMRLEKLEKLVKRLSEQLDGKRRDNNGYNGNNRRNYDSAKAKYDGDSEETKGESSSKPRVRFERSEEGKPVCNYCSKVGHTSYRCWKKQADENKNSSKN